MTRHTRTGTRTALVALLLALSCGAAQAGRLPADAVAKALDAKTLVALDGSRLNGSSLHGQVVVVTFWATWCKPCRREMPRLAAIDRALVRRGGRVVAISIDEDPGNVRRFARSLGLALPLYVDGPNGLARTLDLEQVPSTFVLDRDGTMVHVMSGSSDADLDRLASVIEKLGGGPLNADGEPE